MLSIYRDNQFEKCLEYLKRGGGTGALVARRAETLIEELAHSDGKGAAETCRLTKNGEARIRNCRKYNLGFGYRLVCIRQGHRLILLYAGTHDDCDRWLEHNRGLRPVLEAESLYSAVVVRVEVRPTVADADPEPDDRGDELMTHYTDKDLRMLFRGLWER